MSPPDIQRTEVHVPTSTILKLLHPDERTSTGPHTAQR